MFFEIIDNSEQAMLYFCKVLLLFLNLNNFASEMHENKNLCVNSYNQVLTVGTVVNYSIKGITIFEVSVNKKSNKNYTFQGNSFILI